LKIDSKREGDAEVEEEGSWDMMGDDTSRVSMIRCSVVEVVDPAASTGPAVY
jgi:hypothetical protein